ncbi:hypothetical protein BJ170DRAFT_640642 [Xylariales sp. AK1849]|nr:hypothetical protein BJ170DRAFT_640642 [Xylariales sp. AK1849]
MMSVALSALAVCTRPTRARLDRVVDQSVRPRGDRYRITKTLPCGKPQHLELFSPRATSLMGLLASKQIKTSQIATGKHIP